MKHMSTSPFMSIVLSMLGVFTGDTGSDSRDQTVPEEISEYLVDDAARVGCTDSEIANRFMITEQRLLELYEPNLVMGRATRAYNLRKAQSIIA